MSSVRSALALLATLSCACGDSSTGAADTSSSTGTESTGTSVGPTRPSTTDPATTDSTAESTTSSDTDPTGTSTTTATSTTTGPPGRGFSLRFFGGGVNAPDADRFKIPIDDIETNEPGPPADVGSEDFTIEFWMRGSLADNPANAIGCGDNINWINGNIIMDRDRFGQPRAFGLSLGAGVFAWGVLGPQNDALTICGTTDVLDGGWHHVAIERRRSDGRQWLFVDGMLEAEGDGPDGDVSYPDDGVPGNNCGGPCDYSDPFFVFAAEKHDAGPSYPSFNGWIDEIRFSNVLRYQADFPVPTDPFTTDADTVALFHFDEGMGTDVLDTSNAAGGPSDGFINIGGDPEGPLWSDQSPF